MPGDDDAALWAEDDGLDFDVDILEYGKASAAVAFAVVGGEIIDTATSWKRFQRLQRC